MRFVPFLFISFKIFVKNQFSYLVCVCVSVVFTNIYPKHCVREKLHAGFIFSDYYFFILRALLLRPTLQLDG